MDSIPKGYNGKILWIDLSTTDIKDETLEKKVYRQYLGGYGLGAYIIYSRMKPKVDALGPDNIIGFCPGLLTGNPAPFTGRFMVCAKSPLTGRVEKHQPLRISGGWGDANSGGFFGAAIKRAGYDGIFITGKSKKPCVISIEKDATEIVLTDELVGKSVSETETHLKMKFGRSSQIASIGVAGEKLSRISGIVTDKGRIAARSGLGAVMGSKNLKAICISRKKSLSVHNKDTLTQLSRSYTQELKERYSSPSTELLARNAPQIAFIMRWLKQGVKSNVNLHAKTLHKWGTSYATGISSELGDLPIKNYLGAGYTDWPQTIAEKFSGQYLLRYKKRSYGCFSCPLQCGAILEVPEAGLEEIHRPEYETLGAFGGLILNDDITKTIRVNHLLNEAGMDTISAGAVLAFVLECVEKGILTKEDFVSASYPDGFLPTWGNPDYIIPLITMMIHREGIGDTLADGVRVASLKIQKGSEGFAFHFAGQEPGMHDARLVPALMIAYEADPTPGRHTTACLDYFEQGEINKFLHNYTFSNSTDPIEKGKANGQFAKFLQTINALGFCEFALWMGEYPLLEIIHAVTGWELNIDEFLEIGWRIQTLRQQFNVREAALEIAFNKNRLYGNPPLQNGPLSGKTLNNVQELVAGYFEHLGWDSEGKPLPETLEALGLNIISENNE
ncbi:MAG: aldehyde ferredoxin oxidoreductase family protein [Candidatus Lokiarchaeota archaeon]|nr:aldehyde ferredoxin oxidoreductase family protein [Candidatus Lokiarchaeota archaeon]